MEKEFMAALQRARFKLTQIEAEQRRLAMEKAQLVKTIEALAPMLTENPTREALSLADAMRTVMAGREMNQPRTVFTPVVVRDMLREMGFDLTPYKNHMASIHTALRRMAHAGELEPEGETGYRWKGNLIKNLYEEAEKVLKHNAGPIVKVAETEDFKPKLGYNKLNKQVRDGKK
jgi:hypothetical protein